MDDLIAFVRAQLDADERVAQAAGGAWTALEISPAHVTWEILRAGGVVAEAAKPDAQHIALWDPARALAEIEAKRQILELHSGGDFPADPDELGGYSWTAHCTRCGEPAPCAEVRLLALPYVGRDGWREDWRRSA